MGPLKYALSIECALSVQIRLPDNLPDPPTLDRTIRNDWQVDPSSSRGGSSGGPSKCES